MFFRKKPLIKFYSFNANGYEDFHSAKNSVPTWFKEMAPYVGDYPPKDARQFVKTAKSCSPFTDAITSGYIVTTSHDLVVQTTPEGNKSITWPWGGELVEVRDREPNKQLPTPAGHSNDHFVWRFPVAFQVPEGYSILVTNPLNRFDLPFTTLSGILDGPYVLGKKGNMPFFVRQDFEGVVPQGTPIVQLIPFKRDNWSSVKDPGLEKEAELNIYKGLSVLRRWYRSTYWVKKQYD